MLLIMMRTQRHRPIPVHVGGQTSSSQVGEQRLTRIFKAKSKDRATVAAKFNPNLTIPAELLSQFAGVHEATAFIGRPGDLEPSILVMMMMMLM